MKANLLLNRFSVLVTSIILGLSLLTPMKAAIAPIAFCEDWENPVAMENGWTGDFTWISGTACDGIYGMNASFSGIATTGVLTSPFIGTARGPNFTNLIGINYLITGTLGTGTIEVQVASSLSGPWTTVGEINSVNHVVSTTCSHYDVPEFVLAKGSAVYIRLLVTRNTGTFDLYIADIMIANICINGAIWGWMGVDPCWGIPVSQYTWYRGLSQWMHFKAKVGGSATYTWTLSDPALGTIVGSGHTIGLFELTGPATLFVRIQYGYCYYNLKSFNIAYDDQYWGGTPTDPWLLKVCDNGTNMIVPYNTAKNMVCNGTATLGICVPKTEMVEFGEFGIEVFPNPSNGEFWMNINNATSNGVIEIYNLNGQQIINESFIPEEGQFTRIFGLNDLAPGLYLIRVSTNDNVVTERIAIQ